MPENLKEIETILRAILVKHCPPLRVRIDTPANFEVAGTKPCMQGKQKVEGIYYASVVPKPKDVRFYFFPNYTHTTSFANQYPAMQMCLKGKSCFHIKALTPEMENELVEMVRHGVHLYQKQGWL